MDYPLSINKNMSKFYVQTVFKKTYSNGAVRFEYINTQKLYYNEFEYDEPRSVFSDASEQRRYERIRTKIDETIEALLTPAPELLIYENGTFVNEIFKSAYERAERIEGYLEHFPDVGEQVSDQVITIHALEVRKEL
jgi:hypothetical protein